VAVFRYAEPGEPVIAVDMWGQLRQTGRFLVPPDTGLLELLALAGGPVLASESEEVIREVTLKLSRGSGEARRVVFEANVDSLTTGMALPALQDQDVVSVNSSVRAQFDWMDALGIVGSLAALALVVLRIADISGGI
jgi:hypothetical protein